jgi:hypothetical protein
MGHEHLGLRRPRRDDVDAHGRSQLVGERLGQRDDAALRGGVVNESGSADEGQLGGDVDHDPGRAAYHVRADRATAQERAAEVDGQDAVELGDRQLEERDVRADAGVVDEHVDRPEAARGGGDQPLDLVGSRDVGVVVGGAPTGRLDRPHDLLGALPVAGVVDHDAGALGAEALGGCPPDPPARSRHEDGRVLETAREGSVRAH